MAYKANITTSLRGRRIGLQNQSTTQSGGSRGEQEYLVGPEDIRKDHSTAETTDVNLQPYGMSILTTAVSSGVYTLDPPVPGVTKHLVFHTTGANPIYVKTANDEAIASTQGTTESVVSSSQTAYASLTLIPVSTAAWAVAGSLSSAYLLMSGTT